MHEEPRRTFSLDVCVGRGGFGEVYRATMISPGGLETPCALKVLRRDIDPTSDAVTRLRDEGRLLGRLNHPMILKVFDLVVLDGRVALVTEFVDGADLESCMTDRGFSTRALLQAIGGMAAALEIAHSARGEDGQLLQLIHRDIKPTNIRIGQHGDIKLLDFGIAHAQSIERESKTASNVVLGSLPYMAPERFVDKGTTAKSDVFALGVCLFEGLTGEDFFANPGFRQMCSLAFDEEGFDGVTEGRMALIPEGTAGAVIELLRSMLRFNVDERPTAGEVAQRCGSLADDLRGTTLRAWCRTHRFSSPDPVDGELSGRKLTETTAPFAQPEPPSGAVWPKSPMGTEPPGPTTPSPAAPPSATASKAPPAPPPTASKAPGPTFSRAPLPTVQPEAPSASMPAPEAPSPALPSGPTVRRTPLPTVQPEDDQGPTRSQAPSAPTPAPPQRQAPPTPARSGPPSTGMYTMPSAPAPAPEPEPARTAPPSTGMYTMPSAPEPEPEPAAQAPSSPIRPASAPPPAPTVMTKTTSAGNRAAPSPAPTVPESTPTPLLPSPAPADEAPVPLSFALPRTKTQDVEAAPEPGTHQFRRPGTGEAPKAEASGRPWWYWALAALLMMVGVSAVVLIIGMLFTALAVALS